MLRGSFGDLGGCREMNETVATIDLRAVEYTVSLCFLPQCSGANFIEGMHDNATIQRQKAKKKEDSNGGLSALDVFVVEPKSPAHAPGFCPARRQAAPLSGSPPWGGGMGAPSAAYSLS